MGGAYARRDVSLSLALRVPERESVQCTVVEVAVYAPTDGARQVIVHLHVDLGTFQRIEDEHLLGFVPGSTSPDTTDYSLLSTKPIELLLLPDPAALGGLAGASLDGLIDGLVAALGDPAGGPLHEAGAYRWHSVVQEQVLRPGTIVKRGFRSIHAADCAVPEYVS